VVTKLDRPACSLPDARGIADELMSREVKLNLGGAVHDPTDPVGRLLFNGRPFTVLADGRRGRQEIVAELGLHSRGARDFLDEPVALGVLTREPTRGPLRCALAPTRPQIGRNACSSTMITRRLAPDTLRPSMGMTDDHRGHPVVQVIRRRRSEGSRPGERHDGRRVALVIEGGGMRGVVSAGMTAALEQLGLLDAFDEVHGASAGAFNAAFLLAGQAAYLTTLYQHGFGDPRFVSILRALRGGPALDMDYVITDVWTRQRPLRFEAILASPIELHCTATDADRAEIVDLTDLQDAEEIRCALRASGRLPWLAGPPVTFRGRRLLDATLAEAIPVRAVFASATDVLVLQTRPHGVQHAPLSRGVARLTDRYLHGVNPSLVSLRRSRSQRYDELGAWLASQAADPAARPSVCVIRPPAGSLLVGQLEHRAADLQIAGSQGLRAAWMALEGEDPELLATLRAYPRHAHPPASAQADGTTAVSSATPIAPERV
jgi:predicted patatin/cPLA2 family phospholipase